MAPEARSVFFLRDGLTQDEISLMEEYGADMSQYLPSGNEARIKAVYEARDLLKNASAALSETTETMAAALDVSPSTWQRRMSKPTTAWTLGELLAACRHLGIDLEELRQAIRY